MSWQKNISKGLYRISVALSIFFGVITFVIFYNQNGLISGIFASIVVSVIVFGIIALLNWILRGFIGS
jgi:hypothetical protein|tara:strand:+ start:129 stop:332 length:204 start_codon:yes stop_codon:yes gene_type:complete